VAEYAAIEHLSDGYWRYGVICAWHTGLRLSDVALMKTNRLNLDKRVIDMTPLKTRRFNKRVLIPIADPLLKQLRMMDLTGEYVAPPMAVHYQFDQHKTLSMQFIRLARKAGVIGKSFHCFRHTFVTRLLEGGASAELISTITGQTVDQVMSYAHPSIDSKREAMGI
jgi:integrase